MVKLCPDYGVTFVRDRALWMYCVLLVVYGLNSIVNIFMAEAQMADMMQQQQAHLGPAGDPEMAQVHDAAMDMVRIMMAVMGTIYAIFFFAWAWVAMVNHVVTWWITLILQALSLALLAFSLVITGFALIVFSSMLGGAGSLPATPIIGGMSMETFYIVSLCLGALNCLVSLVLTIWWWRRRRMHGVKF